MAAGQRLERVLQLGHRNEGLQVRRVGVGGYQVARGSVVAIRGDAVSGEVEQHPVIGLDEPGHRLAEQRAQGVAARVQQGRVHVEVLLLRQHLRQPPRVADRGLQRRHLLVGIDADDEGVVPRERQRLLVLARCRVAHGAPPDGEVPGEPFVGVRDLARRLDAVDRPRRAVLVAGRERRLRQQEVVDLLGGDDQLEALDRLVDAVLEGEVSVGTIAPDGGPRVARRNGSLLRM